MAAFHGGGEAELNEDGMIARNGAILSRVLRVDGQLGQMVGMTQKPGADGILTSWNASPIA